MVVTWSLHGPNMNQKLLKINQKHCFSSIISLVLVLVYILNALALPVSMIPHTPQSDLNASDSEGNKHKDA